jgi:phage-related minor tail protein
MASKKIKGITLEIGGDTTSLNKALGGVNKQTKDLQSELRQVDRLLKLDPKNTELVAQKQKILAEAVENSKNKLDTLKEAQKQVQQQFDRGEIGEDQYRAFQREVVKAEQELSKFEKQLKDTGIAADQVAKKLGDAGKKMTSMGKTMSMAVTAPIVAAGAASFKFAADLQDAMGASDQIFKDASGSIKEWADNLESSYGIAEAEALTYANTMGAMLQNIGGLGEEEASKQAQTLVELAGDLTAMFGGTTESAVQALTGALKGNNSMLDNYGMGVNDATIKAKALEMGLYDGTGALELQTKQAATLALIMEQTADAQGQAAREAEGASGATRAFQTELKNLATDIGEVLLPVLTPLMASLRDVIKRFGEMSPEMQKTIVIVAGLAAAIGPLLLLFGGMSSGVSAIIGVVTKLIPVIASATTAVGGLSGVIAFITGPIGIAIAAIAAIIAIGVLLYKNWDTIKAKAGELGASVKAKFEDIKQSITNKINAAKDAVWSAIEKIKSFFKFDWEFPKLKLPHFNVSGSFSLNPPSIPKFGVDWYAQGGIFNSPSIIGVGEAGKEAVLPIDKIDSIIAAALNKAGGGQMVQVTAPIYLDGKEIAVVVSKHQHAQIKAANRGVGVLT